MDETVIDFSDILKALEWVSSGQSNGLDAAAFVDRVNGVVIWVGADDDEDPLEDLDGNERYVAVLSRADLGLGAMTALDFTRLRMPNDEGEVRAIFARSGAFARFKDLLARRNLAQAWYAYESDTTQIALRGWMERMALRADVPPAAP